MPSPSYFAPKKCAGQYFVEDAVTFLKPFFCKSKTDVRDVFLKRKTPKRVTYILSGNALKSKTVNALEYVTDRDIYNARKNAEGAWQYYRLAIEKVRTEKVAAKGKIESGTMETEEYRRIRTNMVRFALEKRAKWKDAEKNLDNVLSQPMECFGKPKKNTLCADCRRKYAADYDVKMVTS